MSGIIGVAGCGRMGGPMLANLQSAGFDARGYDPRPAAGVGTDFGAFCAGLTTLVTVVRDAAETDALLFDDQAVITRAKSLQILVISSTLSPNYVKSLRARIPDHITLIDAPMSGAQVRARAGTLTFMVGGDPTPIMPLLRAMGDAIHPMGAFGAGMTGKVLNNLLAASHTAMTRMVLDWADDAGLDEEKLLNLIATSSGQNWLASGFNDIEFARDGHSSDNTIGILVKDVESALDAAPPGADLSLPKIVQTQIAALKPRP